MSASLIASIAISLSGFAGAAQAGILFAGERKLNNLVSELLAVSPISMSSQPFTFARSNDGWILISSTGKGMGTVRVILDQATPGNTVIVHEGAGRSEAVRYVIQGTHTIRVECQGE